MIVVIHGQGGCKWRLCLGLSVVSFPLPTIRKDGKASLVLSRADCSLAQCVHALLIFPLFICQNSVSCYTSSGFLDQKSGRSTNFYLAHHMTVITWFFPPWHNGKVSFRVNQSHYNLSCLSWRACFYAFLTLHIPQPLTCAQTPRWIHYFPVHCLLWFCPTVFSQGLWPPVGQHCPSVQALAPPSQPALACSSCSACPQAAATGAKHVVSASSWEESLYPALLKLQRQEMSAVMKSKLYDLHKPTQLYPHRTDESSTWIGTSRRAAGLGKSHCSPQVRVSILKIKPGTVLFVLDSRAGWILLFTASFVARKDPWQ